MRAKRVPEPAKPAERTDFAGGLALDLCGNLSIVVIVQGDDRVTVDLADVRLVVAAMGDAAADLSGLLA